MAETLIAVTKRSSGVALVSFYTPGASQNTLSASTLDAFNRALDQVAEDESTTGLIVRSSQPGSFIAGVNLFEFADIIGDAPDKARARFVQVSGFGRQVLQRLRFFTTREGKPLRTVALIEEGPCFGGGLELACCCNARLALHGPDDDLAKAVRFRMPETAINFSPDWGGTYLLPRLMGVLPALGLLLSPLKALDASTAHTLGLVDFSLPRSGGSEQALRIAERFALDSTSIPSRRSSVMQRLQRWLPASRGLLGWTVRATIRRIYRGVIKFMGPGGKRSDGLRATLDLVLKSVVSTDQKCQEREAQSALKLAMGETCQSQLAKYLEMLSRKKATSTGK
jgi:enoyl-CoA hydratase/carnithine racemase